MTTFIATALQYVFTRTIFHSFAETVYLASLSLFGLISLFHNILLYCIINFLCVYSYRKNEINKRIVADRC